MRKQIFLYASVGLFSISLPALEPNPNINNPDSMSNEDAMRAYAGLAPYRRIVKTLQEVTQASSVKRSGTEVSKSLIQLSSNLEKYLKTYVSEVSKRLNADERLIVEDILGDLKALAELAQLEMPKITDEKIDPSVREELNNEFIQKRDFYIDQLGLKIMPFFFVAQEEKIPNEAYMLSGIRVVNERAANVINGLMATLRNTKK